MAESTRPRIDDPDDLTDDALPAAMLLPVQGQVLLGDEARRVLLGFRAELLLALWGVDYSQDLSH